ncbi:MAG: type II secretion system F family protein, partial [Bacilli bacterium]|nr:type II secretion system F family protein [Bacilli bacterium]
MKLRNFKYIATNSAGKTVRGRIEAINRNVCLKYLQTRNYTVTKIVEYKSWLADISQITIGKSLPQKQLIFFLKQLGALLNAGVNLLNSLELLALQQESRVLRRLYFELYQHIYNGFSFSKSLAKRPKEFPNMLVQMVEIGELSGELPETIMNLAAYYENQLKIVNGIKGAIRMPLIYLGAAILIAIGMLLFVFPSITELFLSFEGAQLPGITQFFLDIGNFMGEYALYIFGLTAFFILFIWFLNKYDSRLHFLFTLFILKLPIVGKLIQMNNQITIANSLAQMLSNGINSVKALQTIKALVSNVVYKDLIVKTLANIEDGKPFAKSFSESPYIDQIMARMIATGEKTGDVPSLMRNLSTYYNGVSELRVEQLKNSLQPLLLIIVYAMVGVMILAIMLPML